MRRRARRKVLTPVVDGHAGGPQMRRRRRLATTSTFTYMIAFHIILRRFRQDYADQIVTEPVVQVLHKRLQP